MPRPKTGQTPIQRFRAPQELWNAARAKAKAEGRTVTDVLVSHLYRYVSTPPRRKKGEVDHDQH